MLLVTDWLVIEALVEPLLVKVNVLPEKLVPDPETVCVPELPVVPVVGDTDIVPVAMFVMMTEST